MKIIVISKLFPLSNWSIIRPWWNITSWTKPTGINESIGRESKIKTRNVVLTSYMSYKKINRISSIITRLRLARNFWNPTVSDSIGSMPFLSNLSTNLSTRFFSSPLYFQRPFVIRQIRTTCVWHVRRLPHTGNNFLQNEEVCPDVLSIDTCGTKPLNLSLLLEKVLCVVHSVSLSLSPVTVFKVFSLVGSGIIKPPNGKPFVFRFHFPLLDFTVESLRKTK